MNRETAVRITGGGLGHASKMPGSTWGLSVAYCRMGRHLAPDPRAPCFACYAARGRYLMPSVRIAHRRRLRALRRALRGTRAATRYVDAMAFLIVHVAHHSGVPHHRWFDSGDLQSPEHLDLICRVADASPEVSHWLPTQERGFLRAYHARGRSFPQNLTVRVSSTRVDRPQRAPFPGVVTSLVVSHHSPQATYPCPAPSQGNACGSCRACWDPQTPTVAYRLH